MKHKERVRIRFGSTDLDHLAQDIYRSFHANDGLHPGPTPPWKLYKKYEHDIVVQRFRNAAEAAIEDYIYLHEEDM